MAFCIRPNLGLTLAQERRSPSGFKRLLWIQVAVKLDEFPDRPCPARLMADPQACSVVSVEVLVEQQVIPPVGIGLKLPYPADICRAISYRNAWASSRDRNSTP